MWIGRVFFTNPCPFKAFFITFTSFTVTISPCYLNHRNSFAGFSCNYNNRITLSQFFHQNILLINKVHATITKPLLIRNCSIFFSQFSSYWSENPLTNRIHIPFASFVKRTTALSPNPYRSHLSFLFLFLS